MGMFDDSDMRVRMAAYNRECSVEIREKLKECRMNYRRCRKWHWLWCVVCLFTFMIPYVGRKSREKCRDYHNAKLLWLTYVNSFKQHRLA